MKILAVNYSLKAHGLPVEECHVTTRARPFSHGSPAGKTGSLADYARLLGAAVKADFDGAVVLANGHGATRGKFRRLKRVVLLLNSLLTEFLLRVALRDRTKPLVVVDLGDMRLVNKRDRWLLDRATTYFKRELADNVMGSLEIVLPWGMHIGDGCKLPRVQAWAKKMRPISLGIAEMPVMEEGPEKKHDIFYACNDWQIHQVRIAVREFLTQAREKYGYKVYMPEERLSQADFRRAIAESHVCLSPSGGGWDCFRHYESAACGACPVMDVPTIIPYRPYRHGEEAFYFRDIDDLDRLLQELLADPSKLEAVVRRGKAHVAEWHTYAQLKKHVLGELTTLTGGPAGA